MSSVELGVRRFNFCHRRQQYASQKVGRLKLMSFSPCGVHKCDAEFLILNRNQNDNSGCMLVFLVSIEDVGQGLIDYQLLLERNFSEGCEECGLQIAEE